MGPSSGVQTKDEDEVMFTGVNMDNWRPDFSQWSLELLKEEAAKFGIRSGATNKKSQVLVKELNDLYEYSKEGKIPFEYCLTEKIC
jgi:hypothetical protein